MKLDWDKVVPSLKTVVWILAVFFGTTIATIIAKSKDVWNTPERIIAIELIITKLVVDNNSHLDSREMVWETLRILTDDIDAPDKYYYVNNRGVKYKVDIRYTAEMADLAFVSKTHMIYTIYDSDSEEGVRYIMADDPETGKDDNYDLYKE